MGTNLRGCFLFGRAVMPSMVERGGGDIVNMSTYYVVPPKPLMPRTPEELAIVGERPPFTDLYSASKFALTGLTQAWAGALREHGVRVNAICMGETDTPMLRAYWQGRPFPYRVETWIRPEQIAGLVLDLLREGPEGRTGENIGAWVGVPVELPPRDGD
ncbi:MAG: SDR family oxidoreductase [Dehalococcoidia bacterium]|nr:SDR family oxidoreductase [Dehalococcoidia bacterium]